MTRIPAVRGGQPAFPQGLPLVRPHIADVPGVAQRLAEVLDSGQLTNGRYVTQLEQVVAERLQVSHVVAVNSCTAGLMLVYQGLGVSGDVVMPSHTFSASAHAVVWAGGRPRWAEAESSRGSVDPADVAKIVEGAAAISATHLYGHPAEVETLERIADAAGVPMVFDAAHALGSRRAGRPVGGFGAAEVFSLSPTKVTVAGEGGLVATSDAGLAEHVRIGRNYGNPGDYDCRFPGLNARMSELHAVVALASLAGLDERIARRAEFVDVFTGHLDGAPGLRVVRPTSGDVSTYKDLTLMVQPEHFGLTARRLQRALRAEGVDSRQYFWPPIHAQKAYGDLPRRPLPVTEDIAERVLTVPLSSQGTHEDMRRLAEVVRTLPHDLGSWTDEPDQART